MRSFSLDQEAGFRLPLSATLGRLRPGTSQGLMIATLLIFAGCSGEQGNSSLDAEANATSEGPIIASTSVDRATATVGDEILFELEIDRSASTLVELPGSGPDFAGLEVLDTGVEEKETSDGRLRARYWYQLRADRVGSYILPAFQVGYREAAGPSGSAETSELYVEIESVLPAEGEVSDIRDIKPLEEIPSSKGWWILGLVLVLLAALALYLWSRRRTQAAPLSGELVLKPHEIAYRDLDRLRRTDFRDLEALHEYYYAISQVVRAYVEGRFGLNATDLTTPEIVSRLPSIRSLGAREATGLEIFLESCDAVKYAKILPDTEEIETNYERALRFVEKTVPRLQTEHSDSDSEARTATGSFAAAPGEVAATVSGPTSSDSVSSNETSTRRAEEVG